MISTSISSISSSIKSSISSSSFDWTDGFSLESE